MTLPRLASTTTLSMRNSACPTANASCLCCVCYRNKRWRVFAPGRNTSRRLRISAENRRPHARLTRQAGLRNSCWSRRDPRLRSEVTRPVADWSRTARRSFDCARDAKGRLPMRFVEKLRLARERRSPLRMTEPFHEWLLIHRMGHGPAVAGGSAVFFSVGPRAMFRLCSRMSTRLLALFLPDLVRGRRSCGRAIADPREGRGDLAL